MKFLLFLLLAALQGCQSLTYQFDSSCEDAYIPISDANTDAGRGVDEPILISRVLNAKQDLGVLVQKDMANAWGSGYEVLGSCTFLGDADQLKYSKTHAVAVGADVVVRSYRHNDKVIESSEGNVYSYDVYEQFEVYFQEVPEARREALRKGFMRLTGFIGVLTSDISPEERGVIKKNSGAIVRDVINASPAFVADIVPGDVIVSLGGDGVASGDAFTRAIAPLAEHSRRTRSPIRIGIFRDGHVMYKDVVVDTYNPEPFPER